jgi:translation initiation factor 2B subunit (eIF-2B alpha/beta/delta family)
MNEILEPNLTRLVKRIIKALNHAYEGEATKRRILKKEVSLVRKRTLEIKE